MSFHLSVDILGGVHEMRVSMSSERGVAAADKPCYETRVSAFWRAGCFSP